TLPPIRANGPARGRRSLVAQRRAKGALTAAGPAGRPSWDAPALAKDRTDGPVAARGLPLLALRVRLHPHPRPRPRRFSAAARPAPRPPRALPRRPPPKTPRPADRLQPGRAARPPPRTALRWPPVPGVRLLGGERPGA